MFPVCREFLCLWLYLVLCAYIISLETPSLITLWVRYFLSLSLLCFSSEDMPFYTFLCLIVSCFSLPLEYTFRNAENFVCEWMQWLTFCNQTSQIFLMINWSMRQLWETGMAQAPLCCWEGKSVGALDLLQVRTPEKHHTPSIFAAFFLGASKA